MSDTEINSAAAAPTTAEAPTTVPASEPAPAQASDSTTAKSDEPTTSKTDGLRETKSKANGNADDKSDRRDTHRDRRDNDRAYGRGKGSFHKNSSKRRNDEFENLPESSDPVEIRAQVEFYFSSQNLATDEHLFLELDGSNNRPVPIKHICSFKRMRRFKPYSAVVNALRETKDLVIVDDEPGNESIKRKEPLVVPSKEGDDERPPTIQQLFYRFKNRSSNNMATSAYVKGFGDDEPGQIALEQFFRPYGSVMVRKRRGDDASWKGSVFVEFDTEDSQQQFIALDPKPKFEDNDLIIMGKKEYVEMKCKEKGIKPDWEMTEQEQREKRMKWREENGGNSRGGGRGGGRGRGRGRGGDRGGRGGGHGRYRNRSRSPRNRRDRSGSAGSVDSRDWNTRRDRDQKNGRSRTEPKRKDIDRDAHGVPIVKDTRTEAEIAAYNKRKADSDERQESPKKSKLEIKQDE